MDTNFSWAKLSQQQAYSILDLAAGIEAGRRIGISQWIKVGRRTFAIKIKAGSYIIG